MLWKYFFKGLFISLLFIVPAGNITLNVINISLSSYNKNFLFLLKIINILKKEIIYVALSFILSRITTILILLLFINKEFKINITFLIIKIFIFIRKIILSYNYFEIKSPKVLSNAENRDSIFLSQEFIFILRSNIIDYDNNIDLYYNTIAILSFMKGYLLISITYKWFIRKVSLFFRDSSDMHRSLKKYNTYMLFIKMFIHGILNINDQKSIFSKISYIRISSFFFFIMAFYDLKEIISLLVKIKNQAIH